MPEKFFIYWIVSALAIGIVAYILPGVGVTVIGALVLAIVLGLINVFIKPFITLLTLPINIVTLGLFSLVVNALLIMLSAAIVPGFSVSGFWTAFLFSILLFFVNLIFNRENKWAA